MKLRFAGSQIPQWAGRYEYPREETDLIAFKPAIVRAGCLSKSQLRQIARWKSPRSAGHIENNDADFVKEVTRYAFDSREERSRIEILTLLDGVSWPTASVILHLFHQDMYPILDFRALWSVGVDVPKQYRFAFWWDYVLYCREMAQRFSVDMRTLDRALWQYSKEKQPTT